MMGSAGALNSNAVTGKRVQNRLHWQEIRGNQLAASNIWRDMLTMDDDGINVDIQKYLSISRMFY